MANTSDTEMFGHHLGRAFIAAEKRKQKRLDNLTGKPRLACSFSGGRSSAVMLWLCLKLYGDTHDILITFANTGSEAEETLRFVHAVDQHFADGKVVWIEAEFHEAGRGPTAKVVTYETEPKP